MDKSLDKIVFFMEERIHYFILLYLRIIYKKEKEKFEDR